MSECVNLILNIVTFNVLVLYKNKKFQVNDKYCYLLLTWKFLVCCKI